MDPRESSSSDLREIFGDPIFIYTRQQAIEDGVLVDLTQFEVCRGHYPDPLACTVAVWEIIDRAVKNPRHHNDVSGVLHDILWMSRVCRRSFSVDQWTFEVKITGTGRKTLCTFKMVAGAGDDGEPALTLMMPDED